MSKKRSHKSKARSRTAASSRKIAAEPKKVDFSTEYHYVLNDLRRFGILAVAMFATLIVLALALG